MVCVIVPAAKRSGIANLPCGHCGAGAGTAKPSNQKKAKA
jgi:hypothetical protein